ncbi:MAG: phosphate acetyltransferase [Sedimentisphaerales bacterium]|nr:phosphate acetyltransferase [Sedimentisphaerales bacterium]
MPLFFDTVIERAKQHRKRIVLPEGADRRMIEAAAMIRQYDFAELTVLGDDKAITQQLTDLDVSITEGMILNPANTERKQEYARQLFELRKTKGMTESQAEQIICDPMYFGTMMVKLGHADGLVAGAAHSSADTIRPALQIIKAGPGCRTVSSMFFMCWPDRVLLFADCGLNQDPNESQLVDIAVATTRTAFLFGLKPRVAILSYSTKGSGAGTGAMKMARAAERAAERIFALFGAAVPVDGELQFDAAFVPEIAAKKCPKSKLKGNANVFIFPDLNAGNICYKAVQRLAGAEAYGPVLQGLDKPVNDLSRGCSIEDIVATVAITAIQASEGPIPV